jgi:LacI family transcriptional regulator
VFIWPKWPFCCYIVHGWSLWVCPAITTNDRRIMKPSESKRKVLSRKEGPLFSEGSTKGRSPREGITLRHVAAEVGVSPMTVSNLINGRLTAMSAATRSRIEAAIERLGYRPHTLARSLRLSKRLSIGMIVVDDMPHYLADPFITQVVAGLSNAVNDHGYGLLLQGLSARAFSSSPVIRDIRTDGNCVMMSGPNAARRSFIETLLGLHQPLVLFQETLRFPGVDICSIRQADRVGGYNLAKETLKVGARRLIMPVPDLYWPAIGERIAGVRAAVRETENGANLRIVKCGNAEFIDTQSAIARDMEEHGLPDAILAGNDQMGIAAMKLVNARGLKIPDDILITGFNAFEFWQYTEPMLTTVRSPAYEIGARGGAEILKRLSTGRFEVPEIVYPVALQRGGSI